MTPTDWSREIAALTPFIQGNAIELGGTATGQLAGPRPVAAADGGHDLTELADASVDAIVAIDVLGSIADPVDAIGQWRRVLREGGTLAVICAGRKPPRSWIALTHRIGGLDSEIIRPVRPGETWLAVWTRRQVSEIRGPMGTFGPHLAALANADATARGELYFQLGAVLLQAGDPTLAEACFTVVTDLESESAAGCFGLGMCAAIRGEYQTARARLQRAIELDGQNAEAGRWLELVDRKLAAAAVPPAVAITPARRDPPTGRRQTDTARAPAGAGLRIG